MKTSTMAIIMFALILIIGGFFFVKSGSTDNTPSGTGEVINSENAQKITLGMKNFNYYPDTIKVKSGQPVSITLDSSVAGCLRSFTIKDLGVRGYSASPSETIDFTPTQKGTFKFSCSMGMGYGTIIVE